MSKQAVPISPWPRRMLYLALGFITTLLVIGGVILAIVLVRNNASCTVGATGFSANVTLTGVDAPALCEHLLESKAYYRYEREPQGNQVCAGDFRLKSGGVVRGAGSSLLSAETVICKTLSGG